MADSKPSRLDKIKTKHRRADCSRKRRTQRQLQEEKIAREDGVLVSVIGSRMRVFDREEDCRECPLSMLCLTQKPLFVEGQRTGEVTHFSGMSLRAKDYLRSPNTHRVAVCTVCYSVHFALDGTHFVCGLLRDGVHAREETLKTEQGFARKFRKGADPCAQERLIYVHAAVRQGSFQILPRLDDRQACPDPDTRSMGKLGDVMGDCIERYKLLCRANKP